MFSIKKIQIFSIAFICILAVACKKKATPVQDNGIPYVPINLVIYPGDPLNYKIQTQGGWQYFSGGVAGIIVYRKTTTEFVALERASTYYPDNFEARAKVQADAFTLKDTISGSKWQIFDGAVISGPATLPLRIYNNTYDGNVLRITN